MDTKQILTNYYATKLEHLKETEKAVVIQSACITLKEWTDEQPEGLDKCQEKTESLLSQRKAGIKEMEDSFDAIELLCNKLQEQERMACKATKQQAIVLEEIQESEPKLKTFSKKHEMLVEQNKFDKEMYEKLSEIQTHQSQANLAEYDFNLLNEILGVHAMQEEELAVCAEKTVELDEQQVKKLVSQLITGIHVVDQEDSHHDHQLNIQFTNLPDAFLDFDDGQSQTETYRNVLKNLVGHLSSNLIEKYRSVFRKRKTEKSKTTKSKGQTLDDSAKENQNLNLAVNDVNDFELIKKNYTLLVCQMQTKAQIQSCKKVPIDWVEGSQVVNILLDPKRSRIATLFFPKYFPFSGTSQIKLINLSKSDESEIAKFQTQIQKDFGSFSEWAEHLVRVIQID